MSRNLKNIWDHFRSDWEWVHITRIRKGRFAVFAIILRLAKARIIYNNKITANFSLYHRFAAQIAQTDHRLSSPGGQEQWQLGQTGWCKARVWTLLAHCWNASIGSWAFKLTGKGGSGVEFLVLDQLGCSCHRRLCSLLRELVQLFAWLRHWAVENRMSTSVMGNWVFSFSRIWRRSKARVCAQAELAVATCRIWRCIPTGLVCLATA